MNEQADVSSGLDHIKSVLEKRRKAGLKTNDALLGELTKTIDVILRPTGVKSIGGRVCLSALGEKHVEFEGEDYPFPSLFVHDVLLALAWKQQAYLWMQEAGLIVFRKEDIKQIEGAREKSIGFEKMSDVKWTPRHILDVPNAMLYVYWKNDRDIASTILRRYLRVEELEWMDKNHKPEEAAVIQDHVFPAIDAYRLTEERKKKAVVV